MKKVIIIGAGGHSAEITDYITHYNNSVAPELCFDVVGYIDDNKESYNNYSFLGPYIGTIKDHEVSQDAEYIMGIANIQFRRTIIQNFLEKGARFATLIHPTAIISPSATVGNFNMLNSRCTIGHDSILGEFNFIGPQVVLSGFTKVGNNNMFGVNSATIPTIEIGDNNTIAAGMIITKTVKDNETHFYRFKEKVVIT